MDTIYLGTLDDILNTEGVATFMFYDDDHQLTDDEKQAVVDECTPWITAQLEARGYEVADAIYGPEDRGAYHVSGTRWERDREEIGRQLAAVEGGTGPEEPLADAIERVLARRETA
ncbi:hypothetical protein [Brachybacterium hainanense]|uniref:Uncharacterized protein n=1 Tax=Brachybacterium hainanense TaxID=1541174 RepID=A0ABV6R9A3_9MICO